MEVLLETDVVSGKRTLAVRLGRGAARAEWALLVAAAYLVPVVLWLGWGVAPWVLLPWVSAPRAIRLLGVIRSKEDGPSLNEALAGTAQLGFLFSVLFALGLAA